MNYLRSIASDYSTTFNFEKFATMRGYVTVDELDQIVQKRLKLEAEIEKEKKDFEEKFIQKYGSDQSKWSPEILEMYENEQFE